MKHLKKFNEAEIINPHAWRNKPAVEKETNVLDMVRGGDVNALEDFLHANEADLKRNVTMAAKFSAPGTRHQNTEIYDYVMDHYNDIIDMEAVANWLKYDRSSKSNSRDIDSEGNDWYGFDHPEDLGESLKHIKKFNESNESKMIIDSNIKKFLDKLTNHENSKVSGIAKAILNAENKNFEFGSVNDGKESKIGRLVKNNIDREFPDGSIEMFVNAFAALNDGSSTIKIK